MASPALTRSQARSHPLAGIRGEMVGEFFDFTIHKALEIKGLLPSGDVEVKGESLREAPGDD